MTPRKNTPFFGMRPSDADLALLQKLKEKFPTLGTSQILRLGMLALAKKEGIAA